jgi:hypothetical protein
MIEERDEEDSEHFKMRLDTAREIAEEPEIPAEINELKLEKISQRVTLISVLIPVLIVIVLVITYLDIKKRVTQTEDTGNIEFQKLSADLESRFSSLSVRQARLEDAIDKFTAFNTQNSAAMQVRFEKIDDAIKKASGNSVGKNEFSATKAELTQQLNTVVSSTNEASQQVAAITQEVKKQMDQMSQTLAAVHSSVAEQGKQIATLNENKIDKAGLDLALRLEIIKSQNELKAQIETLQDQMALMESRLSQSGTKKTSSITAPPAPAPAAKPQGPPPAAGTATSPSSPSSSAPVKIEEQNIAK